MRVGILLANLLAPPDQQDSGKATFLKPKDIAFLTNKKADKMVAAAEQLMDAMRAMAEKLQLLESASKALGRSDARIIYHLLGLGAKSLNQHEYVSLDEIGVAFMDELKKLADGNSLPATLQFPSDLRKTLKTIGPKGAAVAAKKNKERDAAEETRDEEPAAASSQHRETLKDAKSHSFQVAKLGFEVEALIKEKKRKADEAESSAVWKVMKVTDKDGARVKEVDGDAVKTIALCDLAKDYKVVPFTSAVVDEWQVNTPFSNKEYAVELVKGALSVAIFELGWKHNQHHTDVLQLFSHPTKITALERLPCHKLVMVPLSRTIGCRKTSDPCPKRMVDLGEIQLPLGPKRDGMSFHIAHAYKAPSDEGSGFVSLFWLVGEAEPGVANMTEVMKKVTINVGPSYKKTVNVACLHNASVIEEGAMLTRPNST